MLISTANAQWNSTRSNTWWSQTEASLDNIITTGLSDSTDTKFIIGANGDTLQVRGKFYFWRGSRYVPEDSLYTIAQIQSYVTGLGYIIDGNTNWNNTYGFYSTAEEIQDIIGAMLTGNTETDITVTYQDADGTIDFVVTAAGSGLDSLTVVATIHQYLADSSYTSTWTGAQIDSLLNILHTNDGLWLTSVLLPSGTNPTTDATGEAAIDTDDNFIEFYNGTSSMVIPSIQIANYTILYPDSVQPRSDDVILAHYPAEIYPHGITITYVAISTSAAVSDTHVLEEWTTSVIASATQTTIESLALSTAAKVESTSIDDASIAADSYLNINLDATTDNIDWLIVTIGYYANPGD